jgi:hypothetical protein
VIANVSRLTHKPFGDLKAEEIANRMSKNQDRISQSGLRRLTVHVTLNQLTSHELRSESSLTIANASGTGKLLAGQRTTIRGSFRSDRIFVLRSSMADVSFSG